MRAGFLPVAVVLLAPLTVVAVVAAAQYGAPQLAVDAERLMLVQNNPLRKPTAGGETKAAARTPAQPTAEKLEQPLEQPPAKPATKQGGKSAGTSAEKPADKTTDATVDAPKTKKFDPIEVNGKYFEGWPKPKLAILITGRQDGYLEPCGCAGLENQKGGVSRRFSLIKQLQGDGWPLLSIDTGGLVRRFGKQSEIKFAASVEALKTMGYQAVGFGPDDLRLSAGEVAAAIAGPSGQSDLFVSANVGVFDLTPKARIVKIGGRQVGITSVLGDSYHKEINNSEVEFTPAAEGLAKAWAEIKNCQTRILLSYAKGKETEELVQKFPDFDIVVLAEGGEEPDNRPGKIPGSKAKLIEVGQKGMFAVVLGLYDDAKQPWRYQRVALDSRFPGTAEMKQLMASYQQQLQALGWDSLGLRPLPFSRGQSKDKLAGEFAGVKSCKECHPTAYKIWEKSKHHHATEALVQADPPRQFDPECISCHATGWNPQEFFPYATGFVSLQKTPDLAGNTCENCHGPSAAHVAAEQGKDISKREAQRAPLRLQAGNAELAVCHKCHDHDNSPEFKFDPYWAKIVHKGKK